MDPPSPAGYNMAVDEALADACRRGLSGPTLRLYEWDRPAISLGYFQRAEHVVDLDQCREAGVPVVRRTTGGRAVVHHRELTYSLVAPVPHPGLPPTIRGAYEMVARSLAHGLAALGLPVEVHARDPRPTRHGIGSPLCFDSTSRSEIRVNGKKVVGSAQRRWNTAFLQHGSVIVAPAPDDWTTWFQDPSPDPAPVCGLSETGRVTRVEDLRNALCAGFGHVLGIRLVPGGLSPAETAIVADTADARDLAMTLTG